MKKTILIACVALLFLIGCNKKEEVNTTPVLDDANNDIVNDEDMAIVEISDSQEFLDELDIKIDSTIISEDATLSILDGKIGEISFIMTAVNGGDTLCTLRMTRDEDCVNGLSGFSNSEIKDSYTITTDYSWGNVDLECGYVDSMGITVYTFEMDGTHFALTIEDGLSQMTIGSILDRIFEALQ